jgi:hypothetical protein
LLPPPAHLRRRAPSQAITNREPTSRPDVCRTHSQPSMSRARLPASMPPLATRPGLNAKGCRAAPSGAA